MNQRTVMVVYFHNFQLKHRTLAMKLGCAFVLQIPAANMDLPIFYGHGTADPLIASGIASATHAALQARGISNVQFKLYPGMGHSTCPQELQDIKRFLLKLLPDVPPSAEEIKGMSARELKGFLQSKGISTVGLLEKQDLVAKALSAL